MGRSHTLSGLAVGALALPLAPVTGTVAQLAWVAAVGGAALLPDLDQGGLSWKGAVPRLTGSTVATMWGPVTTTLASAVGRVARGHRTGTHDVVVGPLAFAGLVALADLTRWSRLVALAFVVGMALHALAPAIPGRRETTVVGNLVLSFGSAWALTTFGAGSPQWLPMAVLLGCLVHVAGDWPTPGGVPVPFTWLDGRARRTSLDLFGTGSPTEKVLRWVLFTPVLAWGLYAHVPAVQDVALPVLALGSR